MLKEPSHLMSKFNQLCSLSWWISVNMKEKVITHFSGKDGSISVRIYPDKETQKAKSIYRVENIWLKNDNIVLKEMDNVVKQLLLIKNHNE
jgi:hypothetical protein